MFVGGFFFMITFVHIHMIATLLGSLTWLLSAWVGWAPPSDYCGQLTRMASTKQWQRRVAWPLRNRLKAARMGGKPLLINPHVEKARLRAEAEAGRTLRKRFERLRKQQEQEAEDRDDSDGDFWVPDEDPECD